MLDHILAAFVLVFGVFVVVPLGVVLTYCTIQLSYGFIAGVILPQIQNLF